MDYLFAYTVIGKRNREIVGYTHPIVGTACSLKDLFKNFRASCAEDYITFKQEKIQDAEICATLLKGKDTKGRHLTINLEKFAYVKKNY